MHMRSVSGIMFHFTVVLKMMSARVVGFRTIELFVFRYLQCQ